MAQAKRTDSPYRICVEGHVGMDWVDWPSEMNIRHAFDHEGKRAITYLLITVPDQPALYGLLEKLRDLNLKLVYLQQDEKNNHGNSHF